MKKRREFLIFHKWNTLKWGDEDKNWNFNLLPAIELRYDPQGFYETGENTPWCKEFSICISFLTIYTTITWFWGFYET